MIKIILSLNCIRGIWMYVMSTESCTLIWVISRLYTYGEIPAYRDTLDMTYLCDGMKRRGWRTRKLCRLWAEGGVNTVLICGYQGDSCTLVPVIVHTMWMPGKGMTKSAENQMQEDERCYMAMPVIYIHFQSHAALSCTVCNRKTEKHSDYGCHDASSLMFDEHVISSKASSQYL